MSIEAGHRLKPYQSVETATKTGKRGLPALTFLYPGGKPRLHRIMTCREHHKHIVHNPAYQNMPRTPDATRERPAPRMPEMVMDETVDDLDA
jgi:hypothetical protein